MGYVVKPIGKLYVRIDNYQNVSKSEKKEVNLSLIEEREGIDILVYPESNGEFDYFYEKHVQRNVERKNEFSVLVVNELFEFNKTIARLLLEQALRIAKIRGNIAYAGIPQVKTGFNFSVRVYNPQLKDFTSTSKDCCFIFRDIQDVTNKPINLSNKIFKKELDILIKYLKDRKDKSKVYLRKILFIEKYFVATST